MQPEQQTRQRESRDAIRLERAIVATLTGDYGVTMNTYTVACWQRALEEYSTDDAVQALGLLHRVVRGRYPFTGDVVTLADTLSRYRYDVCREASAAWARQAGESDGAGSAPTPARWEAACKLARKTLEGRAPSKPPEDVAGLLPEDAPSAEWLAKVAAKMAEGMSHDAACMALVRERLDKIGDWPAPNRSKPAAPEPS